LWRVDVIRALGFLDDGLFFSYEDVDLSFRARLAGYECWYAPRAVAFHIGGATSLQRPEFEHFHAIRNRWSVIVTDVPGTLLCRNAHRIALAEALTIARSAREGHLRLACSAYREIIRSIPHWRVRRRRIQATRIATPERIEAHLTKTYPDVLLRLTGALTGRRRARA
jgi:GT2 family glycosyltransferase